MSNNTVSAIATAIADTIDELLVKARREGAAEAFEIARTNLSVGERGIEWDLALDVYADTFGEMAP